MKASQLRHSREKLLDLLHAAHRSLLLPDRLPDRLLLVIHRQPLPWPAAMVLNEVRLLLGSADQQYVCHYMSVYGSHMDKANKTKRRSQRDRVSVCGFYREKESVWMRLCILGCIVFWPGIGLVLMRREGNGEMWRSSGLPGQAQFTCKGEEGCPDL